MKAIFPPSTPQSAYILGFYAADGNLASKCTYAISQKEKCILEKMERYISGKGLDCSVYSYLNKDLHKLDVKSNRDCEFLSRNNLGRGKTYFAKDIEIDRHLLIYFVIGLIDGDGHISGTTNIYSASRVFSTWVVRILNDIGICASLKERLRLNRLNYVPMYDIKINDLGSLLRLYCFSRKLDFVLDRKWDKLRASVTKKIKSRSRRSRPIKTGNKVEVECTCGTKLMRQENEIKHHRPTCKACVYKYTRINRVCTMCKESYHAARNQKTPMCTSCRLQLKEKTKLDRKKDRECKWIRQCRHCDKSIIRRYTNKTGLYLCQEHSKYSYMYKS